MRIRISLAALATAGMLLTNLASCGKEPVTMHANATDLMQNIKAHQAEPAELSSAFLKTQTDFALRLVQQYTESAKGDNLLLSPYSVMQALAMTANGAANGTLEAMLDTLAKDPALGETFSIDALNKYLSSLRGSLSDRENIKLATANSIWLRDREGFTVEQDFLQRNADYYNAAAYKAPFDAGTVSDINRWVKDNTDGMIPKLLDEIQNDSMMYLINAVAFDAKWLDPYLKNNINENGSFTAADGTEQTVTMLNSTENVFISGEHVRGFEKPYEGGCTFVALLPDEGITPEEYLASLTADALQEMLHNAESCDVITEMPEFSYDFDTDLKTPLSNMGMGEAFTGNADFSAMSKDTELYIGAVKHKTHIELTAQGTKAAAVTSVEMKCMGVLREAPRTVVVTLDRPYVYMIIDDATCLPLFIGTVNSIA